MQLLLDFFHQTDASLFRIQLFRLFQAVHFILFHVHYGKIQQMLLFSSLGNGKGYIVHLHIQFKRYDDFAGSALISFTHLNNAQL